MRHRMLGSVLLLALLALLGGPAGASGPWVWPLTGPQTVARPFEPPATRYGPGHRGADLPGRVGAAVRAAGAGRISSAGLLAGRGVVVVVHGELRTTYEPVTASVRVGQSVLAGQVIGALTAGHPGCATACLHWGLLRGDVYLDPVRLVRQGPSRLLPVVGPLTDPALPVAARPPLASPVAVGPAPSQQPRFVLRAADAGWGTAALLALVAGLALLRPRRPPDGPVAPAGAPPVVPVGLVDLTTERQRRRHHAVDLDRQLGS